MGAKDVNDKKSIFNRWENSSVGILTPDELKKKNERLKQDEIRRKNMVKPKDTK